MSKVRYKARRPPRLFARDGRVLKHDVEWFVLDLT